MKTILAVCLYYTAVHAQMGPPTTQEKSSEVEIRHLSGDSRVLTIDVVSEFPTIIGPAKEGGYSGMLADIWEETARMLNIKYELRAAPEADINDKDKYSRCFQNLRTGKSDVLLAPITITGEREQQIDFTFPYGRFGLRILVRNDGQKWTHYFRAYTQPPLFIAVAQIAVLLGIGGLILWLLERKQNNKNVSSYGDGVELAFMTSSTIGFGNKFPTRKASLGVVIFIFFSGVFVFSNFISETTAAKTADILDDEISCPEDLKDQKVATVAGSTTVKILRDLGARIEPVGDVKDAFLKLITGEVDAVVYDSPAIEEFDQASSLVKAVGPLFAVQYYGIALQPGSPLREKISHILLNMHKSGRYKELATKWHGSL